MPDSFVDMFNQLKIINCMCPKCNGISRLSELKLRSNEKVEKIWLDVFEDNMNTLSQNEDKLKEKTPELKAEGKKYGRETVIQRVNKQIVKTFADLNYNPYDVKAILNPIDFVVFDGMKAGQVENVTLLSGKAQNPHFQNIHRAIEDAIASESYEWKELRVSDDGTIEYK